MRSELGHLSKLKLPLYRGERDRGGIKYYANSPFFKILFFIESRALASSAGAVVRVTTRQEIMHARRLPE